MQLTGSRMHEGKVKKEAWQINKSKNVKVKQQQQQEKLSGYIIIEVFL